MYKPQFPIYIPTKGRSAYCITMRVLDQLGADYRCIVEEQDYAAYAKFIRKNRLLVLPKSYQQDYDDCDDLGDSKSHGPGPARNFAWDHAASLNSGWHWTMDDNLQGFYRFNRNEKRPVGDATIFRCMEDFCLRYRNVVMAGPHYIDFVINRRQSGPFQLNRRIYSCNLIRNDAPFRWRARYNEDTDLSLRMLKSGFCLILFNAFLVRKMETQLIPGGCTTDFYANDGTYAKTAMLVRLHPDCAKFAKPGQFGQMRHYAHPRSHHYVNYNVFKQRLQLASGFRLPPAGSINNYGMKLVPTTTTATAFGRHDLPVLPVDADLETAAASL